MIDVHISAHRYKMFDILKDLGKNAVTWDSTFQTGMTMPSNSVVHDYQGGNRSAAKIAKAGVKVIVSSLNGMCAGLLQITHFRIAGAFVLSQSTFATSGSSDCAFIAFVEQVCR